MTRQEVEADARRIGRAITNLLIEHDKTQKDLAQAIGVSKATVSSWTNGTRIPRMDKINAMVSYFGCKKSDILGEADVKPSDEDIRRNMRAVLEEYAGKLPGINLEYYDDEVVQMVTDRLRTNPKYGVLFKAAANLSPEDIELVTKFIEKMS